MAVISGRVISVSVRETKPSVSAVWRSWVVMASRRAGKFAREIRGIVRVVYFVGAMVLSFDGGVAWLPDVRGRFERFRVKSTDPLQPTCELEVVINISTTRSVTL